LNTIFTASAIARGSGSPLYARVKKLITSSLTNGDLSEGDAIPAERDIAEMLGVSRVTIRKAFTELVRDGILVQRRGSGTYVQTRKARIEQPLSRLTSFTEDMRSRGLKTQATWLDRSSGPPSPDEAVALSISPTEYVSRFHRLRLADGMPMAIELAVIPYRFLDDPQSIDGSLYAILDAKGYKPVRALQRLHAVALDAQEASLLQQGEGSPALYIERISYLADGRTVEYTRSYYPGHAYDFVAELTLAPEPEP
jgi:GntR family transcriptional regulator